MNATVTAKGPLFDGRAARYTEDFCDDWEQEYAQRTEDAVQSRLSGVLKHPTGNYQRHIHVSAAGDGQQIDDQNIIYGPWLEGTGSRNATTRFKGYSTFRKTAQMMDRAAESYADAMFRSRYLGKLS